MRPGLVGVALVLVMAGCVETTTPADDLEAAIEDGRATEVAPPSSPSQESDPHAGLTCDDTTRQKVDATIDEQLLAIADGNWEEAWALASAQYRASTDLETFQRTIEERYPVLLTASGHASTVCVEQGDIVQTLVTVQADEPVGTELVYQLVREEGEWRIDAAGMGGEQPNTRV